jgi:hypothetical protein
MITKITTIAMQQVDPRLKPGLLDVARSLGASRGISIPSIENPRLLASTATYESMVSRIPWLYCPRLNAGTNLSRWIWPA